VTDSQEATTTEAGARPHRADAAVLAHSVPRVGSAPPWRAAVSQADRAVLAKPIGDLTLANSAAADLDSAVQSLREQLGTASGCADELVALCEGLWECRAARDRLREHVTQVRLAALEAIRDGVCRLRALPTLSELLPAAAEEIGRTCEFSRTLISRIHGSFWHAECVWVCPRLDPVLAAKAEASWLRQAVPLAGSFLEPELLRRRVAVLVHAQAPGDPSAPRTTDGSPVAVAAPLVVGRRVVGFIQGDCVGEREVTTLDRDNLAAFAEGLSLVIERTTLLERLRRQRFRAKEVFEEADQRLAGLDDSAPALVRGDKKSVAGYRAAESQRRNDSSTVEQLLTVRELQVVELMVQGTPNRQIGLELVVTEETVKSHVRSISRKLRASNRADAVSRYLRLRLRERP
jgi:DNA-binding CsgD family transcriptional regulator